MAVPKASEDLHAYKAWRASLHAYPNGTIVQWVDPERYRGSTAASDIQMNQCFMINKLRDSFVTKINDGLVASKVYEVQLCSPFGRLFKRTECYGVEGIARWIDEGRMRVIA